MTKVKKESYEKGHHRKLKSGTRSYVLGHIRITEYGKKKPKKIILQVWFTIGQKWKNHHIKPYHNSVNEAKIYAERIRKDIVKFNKKAEKDLRPRAYGVVSQSPMRIKDKTGRLYPATNWDVNIFKKNPERYIKEQQTKKPLKIIRKMK